MAKVSYQPLGPLLPAGASRAFLGLEINEGAAARPVVLVWAPEEVARDPEQSATLARETKRASTLAHPNVLKVHGLAILGEKLARVVEFADGEPLRAILDAVGKLPPRLAALVAADAAMGVHYAHVAGHEDGTPFLHGDIRPETLLVSFSGVCKVSGYGALGLAPKEPGGRRAPGRRWHFAPEQIVGGKQALSRQTDVYLLGLVLYECLAGRAPFQGDPQLDDAVVNRPLPSLPPGEVPPPLIRVVEQATAKRAGDRFPTARALRDAVERAVGVLPAHEELEIFLRRFFPDDAPVRAGRRLQIESAIAELSRQKTESAPPERPSQADPPHPAPAARARAIPVRASLLSLLPLVLLGSWYVGRRIGPPREWAASAEKAAQTAVEKVAGTWRTLSASVEPAREGSGSPPTKDPPASAVDHPIAAEPSPAIRAPSQVAAAGSEAAPARGQPASLELTVDPPVEVAIDGRPAGRSPISLAIAPGKHVVQLSDQGRGINVSRPIRVAANGKTTQRVVIGKGTVEVSAPDGAVIYIDGKPVGRAPLGEIPVFEGKHRILATFGTAQWRQAFTVGANERMSFKIETVEQ